ncbi:hypothetical protein EK21DRAFT_102479 [Setomelanomma holmii]|uniref:Uncharacterized protein n=1 Tax=Setomelanomma holmii TaxID=210430 RepID=A0A9P4H4I9_9PLEO|nr:hypothetical protein EK21DRAFT_102479 [Setomelanomma holmii]
MDPKAAALVEDLFDGWLAMPSMDDFLVAEDPKNISSQSQETVDSLSRIPSSTGQDVEPSSDVQTAASDRTSRQRREHTKSRLGCVLCKRRKVKYTYLMNAILGLAGSHLALQVTETSTEATLSHRQKAIQGLERTFANWPPPAEEAHIMLATSYLLCFQSSYIEDGFLEHILSLRGCAVLSQLILEESLQGPFTLEVNMHNVFLESKLKSFPHLDQELACEALNSLHDLRDLLVPLEASSIERAIIAALVETILPLLEPEREPKSDTDPETTLAPSPIISPLATPKNSLKPTPYGRMHIQNPLCTPDCIIDFDKIPWDTITIPASHAPDPVKSFNALMYSLLILANWPQDLLLNLFDHSNQLGNVVMAHFLAVRFVISPLSSPQTGMKTPVGAMMKWMEKILDAIEDDEAEQWTQYVEWPKKILRCVKANVQRKKGLNHGDIYEMLLTDPAAFKEGRARK